MTTTDPEYDRLRDAVVDAADRLTFEWAASNGRSQFSQLEIEAGKRLRDAVDALRDYRTKSTPPDPVPLRVEPPDEHRGENHHWLIHNDGGMRVWFWRGPSWTHFDDLTHYAPDRVASLGWRYHSPCKPDTRIESTDEAIFDWLKARHLEGNYYVQVLKDALAHFTAPSRIEVSEEATDERCSKPGCGALAGLCSDADCPQLNLTRAQVAEYYAMKRPRFAASAKTQPPCWPRDLHALEHATAPALNGAVMYFRTEADRNAFMDWMCAQDDPPAPTQPAPVQQITDDQALELLISLPYLSKCGPDGRSMHPDYCKQRIVSKVEIGQFARTLLAKHTPTITKDQWEEIRKLAISDAPESFPYGVAKVLGENS